METTTTNGMMPIPIFEIVKVPQYIDWRTAYAVHVNGKKVTIFPDRQSAVEWIEEIKNIFGIQ